MVEESTRFYELMSLAQHALNYDSVPYFVKMYSGDDRILAAIVWMLMQRGVL
jgi:hypothetical protein